MTGRQHKDNPLCVICNKKFTLKLHTVWSIHLHKYNSRWDHSSILGSGRSPGEGTSYPLQYSWASLVAKIIKNSPAVWQTWVRSLDWEYPLEKRMSTHSSILAWRTPMDKGIWRITVHGVAESDTTEQLSTHTFQNDHYDKSSYHLSPYKILYNYWLCPPRCTFHTHDSFIL